MEIDTFYRLTPYEYYPYKKKCEYPCFKLRTCPAYFFKTIGDAENYIKEQSIYDSSERIYAYVLTEIPFNWGVCLDLMGESLSERVYLGDGTLWGTNSYAVIEQDNCPIQMPMVELGNYLGKLRMSCGRDPEEIKFKPGDIVEVFGYSGNQYWSPNEVTLAVILDTPLTKDDIEIKKKEYIESHKDEDCSPHALGCKFGYRLDTYTVGIYGIDGYVDHAQTICVRKPSLPITPQRACAMKHLYEKVKQNDPNRRNDK